MKDLKLDKERMDWLTDRTNRSKNQTQFLFDLLDGDWNRLLLLEVKVKNNFLYYCPGDLESVVEVESLPLGDNWLSK